MELARTHTVIATYRENEAADDSLRKETSAELIRSDIGSAADRAALVLHLRANYSRLDLLVNNAGIAPRERRDMLEATESS